MFRLKASFLTKITCTTFCPCFYIGRAQEPNADVSCNSLKREGFTKSSMQILKSGTYPRLSYCDMEAISGYEGGDMETLITYSDVQSLPGGVFFVAKRASGGNMNTVPQVIVCPNVEINLGKVVVVTDYSVKHLFLILVACRQRL